MISPPVRGAVSIWGSVIERVATAINNSLHRRRASRFVRPSGFSPYPVVLAPSALTAVHRLYYKEAHGNKKDRKKNPADSDCQAGGNHGNTRGVSSWLGTGTRRGHTSHNTPTF